MCTNTNEMCKLTLHKYTKKTTKIYMVYNINSYILLEEGDSTYYDVIVTCT